MGKPLFSCTVQKSDILNGNSVSSFSDLGNNSAVPSCIQQSQSCSAQIRQWETIPQFLLAYSKAKVALHRSDNESSKMAQHAHLRRSPWCTTSFFARGSGKEQTIGCPVQASHLEWLPPRTASKHCFCWLQGKENNYRKICTSVPTEFVSSLWATVTQIRHLQLRKVDMAPATSLVLRPSYTHWRLDPTYFPLCYSNWYSFHSPL